MSRPHPKASRNTALVLAVLTACAVIVIGGGAAAASSHDGCISVSSATVIDQPGCYVLDSDLTASGDPIVEINASDVVFDGQSHDIGGGDPAIHVMPDVSNVTVQNVTVYSSYAGIYIESASDVTVEDVTARNNVYEGISVDDSTGVTIANSTTRDNDYDGIYVDTATDLTIANVTTRNNDDGIELQYASNVTIRDVTHRYDAYWGLHAEDSVNVTVERMTTELSNGEGFDDGAIYFDETNGSIVDSSLAVGEYGLGVELYYSHGTVIDNVTVSASENHALDVDRSEDVVVRDSTFATGPYDDAVYVDNSPDARLTDLSVEGGEYGVALSGSANVTMQNVAMDNSTWGFSMSGHYRHDIDQSNTIDGLPVYIYEGVDGMTFDGSVPRGYLAVVDGSDISLTGFERTDTGQAFVAAHVQGLSVESANLTDNEYGLHVVNSTSVLITDTNVSGSHYGMYLGDSPGATVDSLVAYRGEYYSGGKQAIRAGSSPDLTVRNGTFDRMKVWLTDSDRLLLEDSYLEGTKVEFFGSEDVIIRDNEFVGGGTVVDVRDRSRRATIENNTIANPYGYGISLMENSNGAVIRSNEIHGVTQGTSHTGVGIQLVYTEAHITNNTIDGVERAGIGLSGGTGAIVENNTVTNSPTGIETNINRNTREFVVRHNTIDGVTDGVVLTRYASDAVIEGNAIGNASGNGIEATGSSYSSTKSSNVTITANHVTFVGTNGAYLNNVEEYTVADNTFTNGTGARAIHVSASDTAAVTGNDVDGYGELTALRDQPRGAITVADATNVLVEANSLESSVVGIQILEAGGSVTVSDNAVTNATHVGIGVDAPEATISTNDVRWTAGPGIAIGSRTLPAQGEDEIVADSVTVANNLVVENDLGIAVWDDDATVSANHVERNGAGIHVGSALGIDGVTLVDNVIADNRNETATEVRESRGIVLDHLVGGTVANNTVTNSLAAIQFIATSDVVVEDNRFNDSNQGLAFVQTLSHIDQTADGDPRYTWTPPSTNVTVRHNALEDNDESVHFTVGPSIVVDDGSTKDVTEPTFNEGDEHLVYDNLFNGTTAFNETYAVNESFLPGYERDVFPNAWNVSATSGTNVANGSVLGGNYWASPDSSGYSQTCTDADGDGLCDAPYELAGANNTDWLPLADPDAKASSPHGPIAVSDHFITTMDEPLQVVAPGIVANDHHPDGSSVSVSQVGSPAHGTVFHEPDGEVSYGPDQGFTGTDTFTYRIEDEDGELSNWATVTVEVLPDPDRPPYAAADHYTILEGETLEAAVLENGYDADGDELVVADYNGSVEGGSLVGVPAGFGYTPPSDFTGKDTFTYRIKDEDGKLSNWATVTVEVLPDPDRPPYATADHYTILEGETLEAAVLENDYDPDGDELVVADYNGSAQGASVIGVPAGFGYTPPDGFTGTDTFTYRVQKEDQSSTDTSPWGVQGTGPYSNWATVTVEVLPDPNRAPVSAPDTYVTEVDDTLSVTAPGVLRNDRDLDGDDIGVDDFDEARHGLISVAADGTLTYVPDPGFAGTEAVRYVAADPSSVTADGLVTILVVDPNRPATVAVTPDPLEFGTIETGTAETATVTVTNVGGTPLTVSGVDLAGSETTPFDVVAGNTTTQLATGATHAVTVSFEPTTVGGASETLRIHTNDTTTPMLELELSGTGITSDDGAEGSDGGDAGVGAGSGSDDSSADSGGSDSPTGQPGSDVTVTRSADGTTDVSVENAQNGTAVDIEMSGTGSGNVTLDGLNITPLVDGDFTLNVSVSEDAPPGAPDTTPSGEPPISYLNVDHSIPDEEIGEVTFRLRVSKDTLAARGLAPSDVVVYRYHDGQWQAASMSVVDETATHHVFEATVPGLSVFAVSGQAAVADDPTPPATDEPTGTDSPDDSDSSDESVDGGLMDEGSTSDTPSSSPEQFKASPGVLIAAIVALSVGIGALWLYRRSHRGRP
ncbi:right-handed parallel beta-helix repeat-containing protein [Natronosalvus caseinilyticus]|uniref:right-handed parallel beta-helix repeat-containing protein n=1 Tax=Natronosalvus caseinilyticus TaxID=2953747 RepID=UPI0028A87C55|nr:right-handed parallel beta-helix repeat-containing protein [Natronosalvus caseinilyticus]